MRGNPWACCGVGRDSGLPSHSCSCSAPCCSWRTVSHRPRVAAVAAPAGSALASSEPPGWLSSLCPGPQTGQESWDWTGYLHTQGALLEACGDSPSSADCDPLPRGTLYSLNKEGAHLFLRKLQRQWEHRKPTETSWLAQGAARPRRYPGTPGRKAVPHPLTDDWS